MLQKNSLIMSGEVLGRPETRTSADGKLTICRFNISARNGDNPISFLCKSYNKLAESCSRIQQGSAVLLFGFLETTRYSSNGEEKSVTEMVVTDVYPACKGVYINRFEAAGCTTKDGSFIAGTPEKKAFETTTLAATRNRGSDTEHTEFINLTAFGKQAEFMDRYVKKGTGIHAEGRLAVETYQKKNGDNGTAYRLICSRVDFTSGRKDTGAAPGSKNTARENQPAGTGFFPSGWGDLPLN